MFFSKRAFKVSSNASPCFADISFLTSIFGGGPPAPFGMVFIPCLALHEHPSYHTKHLQSQLARTQNPIWIERLLDVGKHLHARAVLRFHIRQQTQSH